MCMVLAIPLPCPRQVHGQIVCHELLGLTLSDLPSIRLLTYLKYNWIFFLWFSVLVFPSSHLHFEYIEFKQASKQCLFSHGFLLSPSPHSL